MPAFPIRMSLPAPAKGMSLPEPPIRMSLPSPPKRFAAGSAPLASFSEIWSLPSWPKTWMSVVLATVGAPPVTETAPPLTRMWPAMSRLTTMLLSKLSPKTDRTPVPGANDAVTDGRMRSLSGSRVRTARRWLGCLRPDRETGRDFFFNMRLIQDSTMISLQKENRGTAAPPMDFDHPASRGSRSVHNGTPPVHGETTLLGTRGHNTGKREKTRDVSSRPVVAH